MKQNLIWLSVMILCLGILQYYRLTAAHEAEKARSYQQNNTILIERIRKIYDEKILLQQEHQRLEEAASQDTLEFNWYQDISNTAVIKQLRGR